MSVRPQRGHGESLGLAEWERIGNLASLLCDPVSHQPLQTRHDEGRLWLEAPSGRRFEVREGIPVLLEEADLLGRNQHHRRFYDRIAPAYDVSSRLAERLLSAHGRPHRRDYLGELEIQTGSRVLEVAVGTGTNLAQLPRSAQYFGLDISWRMLQRCRRKNQARHDLDLVLGAAERLPFCDAVFDSVFHVGGLGSFNDPARALSEMVRVARPGVRIIVADAARESHQHQRAGMRMPSRLLPPGMLEVEVRLVAGWDIHCLSFRKPARASAFNPNA